MSLLKTVMDRAKAETKDIREQWREAARTAEVAGGAARTGCCEGPWKDPAAVQTPPSHPPSVTDSEWLDLSAQEQ